MVVNRLPPSSLSLIAVASLVLISRAGAQPIAEAQRTAENRFRVDLPKHSFAADLRPQSPFGINTALRPDAPDLDQRLEAMQQAGIKWGRQDFSWRRIETAQGEYNFEPYDRIVEACRAHGILLVGDLTSAPEFHDPRKPEGIEAYCRFARSCVERYEAASHTGKSGTSPTAAFGVARRRNTLDYWRPPERQFTRRIRRPRYWG